MPLSIVLNDNTTNIYTNFIDIPKDIYTSIISLKCNDCNLDNIDFISNLPNLIKLNASSNNIKTIPLMDKLIELEIYNNKLEKIPYLTNLKILYAFKNNLMHLPILPSLVTLDVSNNNLSKIILDRRIEKVFVGYNNLSSLILNGNNAKIIECNNNLLSNIDFIFGLNKLEILKYEENPIKNLPSYIRRSLPGYIINTNSKHILDRLAIDKILNIINSNITTYTYDKIKKDILYYKLLSPEAINKLKKYTEQKYIEPIIRLTYLEFFMIYWDTIIFNNKLKELNQSIIKNNNCECVSCLFKNLIEIV